MKKSPGIYPNRWITSVLTIVCALWLLNASTLRGQSQGRGNQSGNASSNSQAGGQFQGRGNQSGNARGQQDLLTVVAQESFGALLTRPSDESNQWRYALCLPSGSSLDQTFPISFQLHDGNGTSPETADIFLDVAGRLVDSATVSDDEFSISDSDTTPSTETIHVVTDVLRDGAYNLNVQVQARPQRRVHPPHATVLIHVLVGSACAETSETSGSGGGGTSVATIIQPTGPSFFTDSEYNALEKCDGEPASGASDGTFQIVARPNAETIVSTNPGQFYYNLIWPNPGSEQPVSIELSASNLNPKGRNAVHAMLFDSSGFVASLESWDMANEDGTPCGPSGPCTVTVGSGKTLWITWHLEYAGKGESSSGISNSCPGNKTISATGTLKNGPTTLLTGSATATGYLKQ